MQKISLSAQGASGNPFTGPHPKRNPGAKKLSRLELEASIPPPLTPDVRPPALPSKEPSAEELKKFAKSHEVYNWDSLDPNRFDGTPLEIKRRLKRKFKNKRGKFTKF